MDDENKNDEKDSLIDPLVNPFTNNQGEVVIQLMDEIELGQISNSSSSSSLLDLEEKGNIKVVEPERTSIYCIILLFLTTIGAILWALSEGGLYGEGLIRMKLLNESCSRWGGRDCAEGLTCIGGICADHLGNHTILLFNNTCEVCAPQVRCPPSVINKQVSFFDFNEFPAHYLRQGENDPDLKLIKDVPYGACKELCSKSPYCTAVSYHGGAHECHLRKRRDYTINDLIKPVGGKGDSFWIAAFKTGV